MKGEAFSPTYEMNVDIKNYAKDEQAVFALRSLFESNGYSKYKMSRFEEYDLYSKNKSFLENENIITFTDLSGKLLALKPDVTLSIVKNTLSTDDVTDKKVYYVEDVFRGDSSTHEIKTITQVGVEHIGNIDLFSTAQLLYLAKKSLSLIDEDNILDISHQGFVEGLLCGIDEAVKKQFICLIAEKNAHEIHRLAEKNGIDNDTANRIAAVSELYGAAKDVIEKAKLLAVNSEMESALNELKQVYDVLCEIGCADDLNIDFSIVNDMNYYNGIIFQGFIKGVPYYVLSGGRYDRLLSKMGGKNMGAIGFAVYLDLLNLFSNEPTKTDCDLLVIYDESVDTVKLLSEVQRFVASGKRVMTSNGENSGISASEILDMRNK